MKARALNSMLLICLLIWVWVKYARYIGQPIPFLNNYWGDFIVVPVVAHAALQALQLFTGVAAKFRYSVWQLIGIALYTYLLFEVLAPTYSNRYTSDSLDGLAYLAGAVIYYRLQRSLT